MEDTTQSTPTKENLLANLTADVIKDNIKPYIPNVTRQSLPTGTRIDLSAEEIDREDYGETVVYRDDALGQKILMKNLISFFTVEGSKQFMKDEKNDCLLMPLTGKPEQAYDVMVRDDNGAPVAITIHEIYAFQTAKPSYLEKSKNGEHLAAAYKHLQIDITGEYFPLVVPKRNSTNRDDMDGWRAVKVTIVELHYN